jgi:hypothetical protein
MRLAYRLKSGIWEESERVREGKLSWMQDRQRGSGSGRNGRVLFCLFGVRPGLVRGSFGARSGLVKARPFQIINGTIVKFT